jgi:hypothetical protein
MADAVLSDVFNTATSISFFGDDLDPDEISDKLGKQPAIGVKKGDFHLTPSAKPIVAQTGKWILKAEPCSPGDLDGQVVRLLDGMGNDLQVWNDLSARFSGRLFAGLFVKTFNEGLRLRPETLLALGARGLALDLDIYNHAADED